METALANQTQFRAFAANVANGVHDFSCNVFKVMLTNTAPNPATDKVIADIVEIPAGNGYVAGGVTTKVKVGGNPHVERLFASNVTFTANGGSIGPFRYVVMYDSTPTDPMKPLISYLDFGSELTLDDRDTFTVQFDVATGWFMGDPHAKPFSKYSQLAHQ